MSPLQLTPMELPQPIVPPPQVEAAPRARLVLLDKDGTDRKPFLIAGDTLDIGAREGDVILDTDPFISPRHARISRDRSGGPGAHCVLDLDSTNGVYLKLRTRWTLADGDLILLGQQVLRFDTVKEAEHGLGPATQHGVALFGTPPMPRLARLSQRTVEGVTRDVFHIHRAETSLGRETADIVFTDDPFLSRRHAVITHDPATHRFYLEDAGSSNGTYVAIRGRAPLSDGDILRMGLHVFRIELQAAAASSDTSGRS
jgi:pSer/pThr/pTyr-binding forkhead associated (FHA) protein